jgi:hypothetical protein
MAEVKLKRHLTGVGEPGKIVTVSDTRAKLWVEIEDFADYVNDLKRQVKVEANRQKAHTKRIADRFPKEKIEKATGKGAK